MITSKQMQAAARWDTDMAKPEAKPPLADAARSAMFESKDLMAISMSCGHVVPMEQAIEGRDKYCCPICGLRFHVEQDPPKRYPSGFIMPGERHMVIDAQGKSPNTKVSDEP